VAEKEAARAVVAGEGTEVAGKCNGITTWPLY